MAAAHRIGALSPDPIQLKRVKHGHFFGATFLSSCLSRRGSASSPPPFLPHPRFPPICSKRLFSPFLSRRPTATNAHLGRAPIPSLVASAVATAVATAATRVPVAASAQTLLHAPQPLRAHRLSHQDLDTVDYIVGGGGIPKVGCAPVPRRLYFSSSSTPAPSRRNWSTSRWPRGRSSHFCWSTHSWASSPSARRCVCTNSGSPISVGSIFF